MDFVRNELERSTWQTLSFGIGQFRRRVQQQSANRNVGRRWWRIYSTQHIWPSISDHKNHVDTWHGDYLHFLLNYWSSYRKYSSISERSLSRFAGNERWLPSSLALCIRKWNAFGNLIKQCNLNRIFIDCIDNFVNIWSTFNFKNKNSEFCAPLTSFDWNEVDPNLIGTSSIDTTCTIWGLEVWFFYFFFKWLHLRFMNNLNKKKDRTNIRKDSSDGTRENTINRAWQRGLWHCI